MTPEIAVFLYRGMIQSSVIVASGILLAAVLLILLDAYVNREEEE